MGKVNKISLGEKLGYASGDLASNLFWQTFMYFLPYFYTDIFKIPSAVMGTMFVITRLWDTVNDPIMGMIADRTNSRWGKFRPYLLWIALPFGIIGIATFSTPDLAMQGRIIYAYITYTLMMMVYTAINIPYSALMGVLTPDSLERTSISSYRFIFAFAAGLFIQSLTNTLVRYFGKTNESLGFQATMAIYAVVAIGLFLVTFFTTRERVQPKKDQKTSLTDDLKDLVNNRPWVILLLLGIFTIFYVSIRNGSIMYYFKYYTAQREWIINISGKERHIDIASAFMVIGTIAGIVGISFIRKVAELLGKKQTYMILMAVTTIFTTLFFFLKPDKVVFMFILQVIVSLTMGPTSPLVWAMYADTADYSEWKTGRRATGLVFSAATMAQKFGWTIAGATTGWLLASFGYEANMSQSPETLTGIKLLISLIPAAGSLFCAVFVFFYKIDDKLMKNIQRELETRRGE